MSVFRGVAPQRGTSETGMSQGTLESACYVRTQITPVLSLQSLQQEWGEQAECSQRLAPLAVED